MQRKGRWWCWHPWQRPSARAAEAKGRTLCEKSISRVRWLGELSGHSTIAPASFCTAFAATECIYAFLFSLSFAISNFFVAVISSCCTSNVFGFLWLLDFIFRARITATTFALRGRGSRTRNSPLALRVVVTSDPVVPVSLCSMFIALHINLQKNGAGLTLHFRFDSAYTSACL